MSATITRLTPAMRRSGQGEPPPRRLPRVVSWATGRHYPAPRHDGVRWRCSDCGMLLTWYTTDDGQRRLRHHPRGRR